MKIAHYSPMPPERTGVADYCALVVPELQKRMEVLVRTRKRRRARQSADVSVYHVGNNPEAHGWIVEALRRAPGLVVLHDFVVHHLIAGMTLARGDAKGYIDAMHRDAGVAGRLIAHGVVDGVVAPPWEVCPERFPLVGELFPFARGMIVHSSYAEQRLRDAGFQGPIWRVPMPAWPRPDDGPVADRASRGLRVLSFGNLNPSKRLPELLRAFAELRGAAPESTLALAGPEAPELDLDSWVQELGLEGSVTRHGWVDETTLWSLIEDADVCVALRWPTMGETSSVVLRAMSGGLPIVVSDEGWYAELPGSVVAKIPTDRYEHATLVATLELLADEPGVRQAMAREARALLEREHDPARVGDAYASAIEEFAGGAAVRVEVAREVARSAAEVGLEPTDPDVAALSRYLRELGL